MFYVYVLKSLVQERLYIGISADPHKRLMCHNAGGQRSTRPYRPYVLAMVESCVDRKAARQREKFFKSGCGREFLRKLLS